MKRLGLCLLLASGPAATQGILGPDAAACRASEGPAIQVDATGLKDRTGDLKLELYPANETDFLKPDKDLLAAGKTFRRISVTTPAAGAIALCLRVPRPGRYALLLVHNRDGKNKFSFWSDGAGFPGNVKLGRARPKVGQALIDVGSGITVTHIRLQYLRGLGGFGPVDPG
ncbi:DUF2141 domain-containing protein [Sphingomonas sp. PB2P19]|uniref:DUF2141 domain-containing protein n=1 Tax=Sphingomonas rhamnosi TaxID=3096156 RepID=UPI002FC87712